jgi:hypothetical protein
MLSFDYCMEPNTTVNLLLFSSRGRHDLELTDSDGGADTLGAVQGARTDGKWHHADVDLQVALARRGLSVIRQIGLADLGPGASTTATAYRIDNWTLLPAVDGSRPVRFRWGSPDGSGIAGSSAVLDRERDTAPEEKISTEQPELLQAGGLAEGLWYLHVRCRNQAGNWGPSAHWPIKVVHYRDTTPPAVASVRPAEGETACPTRLEVAFTEDGSGLSPHDLEIELGGRKLRSGDPGVTVYPAEKRLSVELADLEGRLLASPGEVRCRVQAADYAGNRLERPFEWTWKLDLSRDSAVPAAPRSIYLPSERLVFEDFERGQGEFAEWRRGTCYRVEARARGEAGSGRWYLATAGRRWHDNNNEIQLHPHAFDPERFNHLAFDYHLREAVGFNFMLQVGNDWHYLGFNAGYWGSRSRNGEMGEAVADGRWHRAEIDLRKLRDKLPRGPDGHMLAIQNLLATFGSQEGMELDNFVLGSSRSSAAGFVWEAPPAASGIAGYSWALDGQRDTVPPEKVLGTGGRAAFRDLKPGKHVFHLRAQSGAGVWGQTGHLPFAVEE